MTLGRAAALTAGVTGDAGDEGGLALMDVVYRFATGGVFAETAYLAFKAILARLARDSSINPGL